MKRLFVLISVVTLAAGAASAARSQTCPPNFFAAGGTGYFEEYPTASLWSGYGFSYDLVGGTLSGGHTGFGEAGSFSQLMIQDRYRIVGPASTSPIPVLVRVRFSGSAGGGMVNLPNLGTGCLGSTVQLRLASESLVDEEIVRSDPSPDCGPQAFDEVLELAFAKHPAEEFPLSVTASLSAGHTIPATASGVVTFVGLPAGYSIRSCRGYGGSVVAVRPRSWGGIKLIYR